MVNTIKATLEADADGTLHLPLPPELRHSKLSVTATLETIKPEDEISPSPNLKGFGCLKGRIWMSPDFDDPLEDFKDYME